MRSLVAAEYELSLVRRLSGRSRRAYKPQLARLYFIVCAKLCARPPAHHLSHRKKEGSLIAYACARTLARSLARSRLCLASNFNAASSIKAMLFFFFVYKAPQSRRPARSPTTFSHCSLVRSSARPLARPLACSLARLLARIRAAARKQWPFICGDGVARAFVCIHGAALFNAPVAPRYQQARALKVESNERRLRTMARNRLDGGRQRIISNVVFFVRFVLLCKRLALFV